MKLAIVGSRTFNDYALLDASIKKHFKIEEIELIVSGGAVGADSLGFLFRKKNAIPALIYWPNWEKYGKSAGMRRNRQIVEAADVVLACWDGVSAGTKNSIDLAKNSGKTVIVVEFKPVAEESEDFWIFF